MGWPGWAGRSQGSRRSAASGQARRCWVWQAMISHVHWSAAAGSRIAAVELAHGDRTWTVPGNNHRPAGRPGEGVPRVRRWPTGDWKASGRRSSRRRSSGPLIKKLGQPAELKAAPALLATRVPRSPLTAAPDRRVQIGPFCALQRADLEALATGQNGGYRTSVLFRRHNA